MIFVTVGSQLAFPRLIDEMDRLASLHDLEVFAQTADTQAHYTHIQHQPFLSPPEYGTLIKKTTLIVGHAGIGTLLTAAEFRIPAILLPRQYSLGEHRNDHQMATAQQLSGIEGIRFVSRTEDIETELLDALQDRTPKPTPKTPEDVQKFLRTRLQSLITRTPS